MSHFIIYFVLCVAVSLSRTYALSEEEKAAFRKEITPIIEECSKVHDVSDSDLQAAKDAKSADTIKPCFLGCVFKKVDLLTPNGLYDVEKGLGKIKEYVKDPAEQTKFEEIGKHCATVNDQAVSDGESGCDRAKLLLSCILAHKAEIPLSF